MVRAFPLKSAPLAATLLIAGVGHATPVADPRMQQSPPVHPVATPENARPAPATAGQGTAKRSVTDSPRPPRSALAKASPAQVAEWVRLIAGRPLNRAEAASLLRDCGVDPDADPARAAALDAALANFRTRWDAFASAELIPVSDQRGTSLADLMVDPARSASFIVDLRARRHGLEGALLDEFAGTLPEPLHARVELAKAERGSQLPVWATGSLIPAGTVVPVMAIAWRAEYVPAERREQVRAQVEPLVAAYAAQRSKLMDGLLRATLESDLMSDRVAADAMRALNAARESGASVDANVALGLAMSRQLLPMICAAGDLQAENARLIELLKGGLAPADFNALMQAYAAAASVPLSPQLDADAALANARAGGAIAEAQIRALAAVADAWRSDDAALLVSWAQSLPGFSRSMCESLGEIRWDDPALLTEQRAQSDARARVQQRQMQLLQARDDRAAAAVAAMKSHLTPEEWERIKPTRPIMWGAPKGSTP
jgi:hypothetical protein